MNLTNMNYNLHSEDDDLQEIAPILSKIPKRSIQAPDGYFEQFPSSLLEVVSKEKKSMNWFGIAATITILLASGVIFHNLDTKSENTVVETEQVSDQYLHEIDEDIIIEYVSAADENNASAEHTDEYFNEDFTEYELLEQYN